ncbi:MAG: MFS transporter [Anaerolineae bacterium]|nr:MFS transporter [Anaerolineae bacterium]
MNIESARTGVRWHYAWVVSAITFTVLLISAGVRTAPGVIIKPLEAEFHWDRASISFAVAVSLFAFGFGAPMAGSLIDRFGPRRVMMGGLALITVGLLPMLSMTALWQLHLLWGLITGIGTGWVTNVLGATVADRWFKAHRGLVIGLFGAAGSAGQLVFLPAMMSLTTSAGWRAAIGVTASAVALLIIPVALLMRDHPQDMNLLPIGDDGSSTSAKSQAAPRVAMRDVIRTRDFWLLAGSFFVCGYTSNGLVGTHLIPHALEHGFTEVAAAGAVALMGMMNIVGTLASGWLSDRYDNRKLLAIYYGFRAVAIAALPFIFEMRGLVLFTILYGLDWIATVPPTVNLTAQRFGRGSLGTIYGWIFCAHMIGAGIAAYAGGFFHDVLGDYHLIFLSATLMGFIAVGLSMRMTKQQKAAVAGA